MAWSWLPVGAAPVSFKTLCATSRQGDSHMAKTSILFLTLSVLGSSEVWAGPGQCCVTCGGLTVCGCAITACGVSCSAGNCGGGPPKLQAVRPEIDGLLSATLISVCYGTDVAPTESYHGTESSPPEGPLMIPPAATVPAPAQEEFENATERQG
jgi:hypothetical protein